MSIKQFYGEMDKKDRKIFSEIEKMIVNSKMECLAVIPKNQVYNDSEIKNKINSLIQIIDGFSNKLSSYEEFYSENIIQENIKKKFTIELEKAERILLELKAFQKDAIEVISDAIKDKTSDKIVLVNNYTEMKNIDLDRKLYSQNISIYKESDKKRLGLQYEDGLRRIKNLKKKTEKKNVLP